MVAMSLENFLNLSIWMILDFLQKCFNDIIKSLQKLASWFEKLEFSADSTPGKEKLLNTLF